MEHAFSGLLDAFCVQQLHTLEECLALPTLAELSDNSSDLSSDGQPTGRATPTASYALRTDVLDMEYHDTSRLPMAPLQSSTSLSTDSESCDEDGATAGMAKSRGRRKAQQAGSTIAQQAGSSSSSRRATSAKRTREECESMCGVLQPFNAVKNYGMAGTMNLQQLNAKLRSSWQC